MSKATEVLIANPVTFLAQKLLIQRQRKQDKRPQDALYIHDTLELFSDDLEQLRSFWKTRLRPSIARRTANRIEQLSTQQFSVVTDVIRNAARIPKDREIEPEQLRAACAYGLGEMFGD